MSKFIPILAIALAGTIGFATWAGRTGYGISPPPKKPPSIREGSVHQGRSGHYRTHYFVGGGPHYGK